MDEVQLDARQKHSSNFNRDEERVRRGLEEDKKQNKDFKRKEKQVASSVVCQLHFYDRRNVTIKALFKQTAFRFLFRQPNPLCFRTMNEFSTHLMLPSYFCVNSICAKE